MDLKKIAKQMRAAMNKMMVSMMIGFYSRDLKLLYSYLPGYAKRMPF
jgi:hypothetical protein